MVVRAKINVSAEHRLCVFHIHQLSKPDNRDSIKPNISYKVIIIVTSISDNRVTGVSAFMTKSSKHPLLFFFSVSQLVAPTFTALYAPVCTTVYHTLFLHFDAQSSRHQAKKLRASE